MASRSFSDALSNLSSDKIKDRTQGLEDVRVFLSVQRNLEWINQDGGQRKSWLKILQAVFQIVVDEQKAYVKKPGTAVVLKRLRDAAQVVRLIIEKAAADIPRKAFKAVFSHIVSVLVVNKRLFEPVALEYLKALRTIIGYQPHLDHLEPRQWIHGVALCFSAALGDPIINLHEIGDEARMEDDDETESATASSTSRKRKATGLARAIEDDEEEAGARRSPFSAPHKTAGQDIIELMSCLEALFRSSASPFFEHGQALLAKFVRFFRTFPAETSAHLPALGALNRLVAELYFNSKRKMEAASVQLWPLLLTLWPTKNSLLKEHLVVAFTSFFPYLVYRDGPAQTPLVHALYTSILAETENRWGVEELDLEHLAFTEAVPDSQTEREPFRATLVRAGHSFTSSQALSWSVFELGASCLHHLQTASQSLQPAIPPTPSSSAKGKRRKIEAPLDNLLDDLQSTTPRLALQRLQLLLFYLEQDQASALRLEESNDLLKGLVSLGNHENPSLHSWSLVVLATLAMASIPPEPASGSGSQAEWQKAWTVGLRRLSHSAVSRSACVLVRILMRQNRIAKDRLLQDLEAIARDIELTGPPLPCDSACDLLMALLDLTSSDIRLFRLNVHEKVYNRLGNHWALLPSLSNAPRAFSQKPHSDPLGVNKLSRLLDRIISIPLHQEEQQDDATLLPDCIITDWKITEAENWLPREWFFHARLPSLRDLTNNASQGRSPAGMTSAAAAGTNMLAVRITSYLRKTLDAAMGEIEAGGEMYWSSLNIDRMRRMADLAVLVLLYEAKLDVAKIIRGDRNLVPAIDLLSQLLPRFNLTKWSVAERAYLLLALDPLLVRYKDRAAPFEGLISAGKNSGIRRDVLARVRPQSHEKNDYAVPSYLRTLWMTDNFRSAMSRLSEAIERLLDLDVQEPQAVAAADDDGFGAIKSTTSTQMTGRATFELDNGIALHSCMATGMRFLVTTSYLSSGAQKAGRLRNVVTNLLEGSGTHFALLGQHLFQAVEAGYLSLSSNELDEILERIGGELLPSYEYARSAEVQLLVLQFLQATVNTWGKHETMELSFVDNARRLSAWFTGQLRTDSIAPHRIRMAFIDLLDRFLSPELDSGAWGHESEATGCDDGGVPITPANALILMISDRDYRVRIKSAPVIGRLCSFMHDKHEHAQAMWDNIARQQKFDISGDNFEGNISLLLTYGNIIVASDSFRSNAYRPIVVYAALNSSKSTSLYVSATLSTAASRLGLQDLAQLYKFLATYTMAEQIMDRQEELVIPDPTAFGFAKRRDLYEARFSEVGAMVLAGPRRAFFDQMCAYVGRTVATCLRQCLPVFIAYRLALPAGAAAAEGLQDVNDDIGERVRQIAKDINVKPSVLLQDTRDQVVAKLFTFIWEPEYDAATLSKALDASWPGSAATITELLRPLQLSFQPNILSPPDVALGQTLLALKGSHPSVQGVLASERSLYGVLHQLLVSSASPPFVSQQLRLLYNSAICIAAANQCIRSSPSLLFLILHRSVRIFHQPDLFCLASSLYRWALQVYVQIAPIDDHASDLGQTMVQAAESATAYKRDPDLRLAEAAQALLKDSEETLARLLSSKSVGQITNARTALSLWPTSLPLHRKLTLNMLQNTMEKPSTRFRTHSTILHLSSLLDSMEAPAISPERLSRLIWHFLAKAEFSAEADRSDSAGFVALADLISRAGCTIQPPNLAQEDVQNLGRVEVRDLRQVQEQIIQEIAALLDSPDLEVVSLAYDTLQQVFTPSPSPSADGAAPEHFAVPATATHIRPLSIAAPGTASVDTGIQLQNLVQDDHWTKKARDTAAWCRDFSVLLACVLASTDMFFLHIHPLLVKLPSFARTCVKYLVHCVLLREAGQPNRDAKHIISTYFHRILTTPSPETTSYIVDICIKLRGYARPVPAGSIAHPLDRDLWLDLDYSTLANAALRVRAFEAALLFYELSREHSKLSRVSSGEAAVPQSSATQDLLYAIYSNINEPDSFYSIHAINVQQGLMRRLHHEGSWREALSWHGAALESDSPGLDGRPSRSGLIESLALSSLPHLASHMYAPATQIGSGSQSRSDGHLTSGFQYDLAWKTEQWDIPLTFPESTHAISQASVFWALRASQRDFNRDQAQTKILHKLALEACKLARITPETPEVDPQALKAAVCIGEIHGAYANLMQIGQEERGKPLDTKSFSHLPYDVADQAITSRAMIFRNARLAEGRDLITDEPTHSQLALAAAERQHLLDLARLSRTRMHLQTALNAVLRAQQTHEGDARNWHVDFEMAKIIWSKGHHGTAIEMLTRTHDEYRARGVSMDPKDEACLLAQAGEWIGIARLEAATVIKEKYFEPSEQLLATAKDSSSLAAMSVVAIKYARFADQQYQAETRKLEDMERLEAYSARIEAEASQGRRNGKTSQSDDSVTSRNRQMLQSQQDRQAVEQYKGTRRTLLEISVEMFGRALALSDDNDDALFRFTSLWLANAGDDAINAVAGGGIGAIPSHKFVILVHQLSARLASQSAGAASPIRPAFQLVLYDLVSRLCADHPFHSLFQIYFLRANAPANQATKSGRRSSAITAEAASQIQRADAVGEILRTLQQTERLKTITRHLETAIIAYMSWADYDARPDQGKGKKTKTIPANEPIRKLVDVPIPVSTEALALDKTTRYDAGSFVTIKRFSDTFLLAGGIHLPKITNCIGSDGKPYKQLYKGGDDVRQDAVMQQVFEIANELLSRDERTRTRNLAIRTYKVIPLKSSAGLLQFVPNSLAIGNWLIDAHGRYNPTDAKVSDVRYKLRDYAESPAAERVAVYKEAMKKVRPVMRHFFTEKHYLPARWFEMRLLYARSTAVMSMVGHILGLGDRHVSNILIDTAKGELIPIDLGIAFEAGRYLRTPELVPFRLTNDIVDGFGSSGVDGVFRKCSEETMRVLRAESAVLMTILEVFKFDPLQQWSASSQKVKQAQGSQGMDHSKVGSLSRGHEVLTEADRAIATVASKLRNDLSVEHAVSDLISKARDPENLGSIYHGWQPHL